MKLSIQITIILFILNYSISSCTKQKGRNTEFEIKYQKSTFYLKENTNRDSELPPILNLEFSVNNFTNFEKVLTIKSSKNDKIKSCMFFLDTVNKKIIPLFSKDIILLKPNSKQNFTCTIKLRKYKDFFNLEDEKLKPSTDLNYTIHKKYFQDKLNFSLKNSIIFYFHDSTDVDYYINEFPNISGFKNKSIVNVNK